MGGTFIFKIMNDVQLARRIVQCFKEDPNFWRPEQKTLDTLYQTDLSTAFAWNRTREGDVFWLTLYNTTLRTNKDLRNFLEKNLIEDSNFIELEFFI